MFLSISAAILHGLAYAIYLHQVYGGTSVPNPASWTIWALLSTLNALSFWRGSRDPLATAQFFTGAVACFAVWALALNAGKFQPLDLMGWIILWLCCLVCLVWWGCLAWQIKGGALYANLIVAGILALSAVPTIMGVWQNGKIEQALPWYMWALANMLTTINVIKRRQKSKDEGVRWRLLLVTPIVGVALHGIVALLATG